MSYGLRFNVQIDFYDLYYYLFIILLNETVRYLMKTI